MIISIAAPKGGVGSSTFALLLAQERGARRKSVLVDAALDPSLDLYSGVSHRIQPEFTGDLLESSVSLEGMGELKLARVKPNQLSQLKLKQESAGADLILDLGTPDTNIIDFLAKQGVNLILVLTQDNAVLRAGDELLGCLRHAGIRCGFIISQQEDRDRTELANLDEIFDLLEENYYGAIPWSQELRIQMNQGKPELISRTIREKVGEIAENLENALTRNPDDDLFEGIVQNMGDPSDVGTLGVTEERFLTEITEAATTETGETEVATDVTDEGNLPTESDGVISKMKRFFQNFGKGK